MRRLLFLLSAVAMLAVACGDNQSVCLEFQEPLDPASALHLIDVTGVTWQTDPPTSGAHLSGSTPQGVQNAPITSAVQVAILESGRSIVQYGPPVEADGVAAIKSLADDGTVIAPGINLPSPIVATAWTWKLTCGSLDLDALRTFTAARTPEAPGTD